MPRYISPDVLSSFLLAAALAVATHPHAASQTPETTLASIGDAKVTVADYEASILRIPEKDRLGWAMSQERVDKEIDTLLKIRAVANEGRRTGADKDPAFKRRVELYAERLLAEAMVAKIDAESAKEFDAKHPAFVERARELYAINRQDYKVPAEVKASHILISTKGRTPEEAQEKIDALRARILAGESFEALAEANSDDPTAKRNKGSLGFFGPGVMDPAFEAAAFALKKPGDLSMQPVKSAFGYHLIRLDAIKPGRQLTFEEATPELMTKLKDQFLDNRRAEAVTSFYDPAKVKWNEPAVLGLKQKVDPAVYKLPEK